MSRLQLVAAFALSTAVLAAQQPPSTPPAPGRGRGPVEIGVVDLGNRVYQLTGGSNAVLAIGTDAAILVDSKFGQPEALVRKVAELTRLPVRYVVNTHSHPDHTGANEAFARMGATVVATARAAEWMSRPFLAPTGNMDPPLPEGGRPKETFARTQTIAIAGQRLVATEVPRSHSDGDAYVYFPDANVLVMGDLHHSNEYPVYDAEMGCRCGSYEANLQAYDAMLRLANDQTKFIPGHGGLTNKAEVTAYVAMLRRVRGEVQALVDQGKTADEVVALKLLASDRSPTSPGPDNRDQFIRVLYNALRTGVGK